MKTQPKETICNTVIGKTVKLSGRLFFSFLFVLASIHSFGATFIAYNTGNWSSRSTWVTTKTGTVTVSKSSTAVVGSGTAFTTQLQVGDKIYRDASTGFTLVGTVASITDNTNLTLTSGAEVALSNYELYSHGLPTSTDDVQIGYLNGTLATTLTVDGNYTCNLMTFVQNGGVAYTVDIPGSKSLIITGYAYLTSTNSNGNISTMNVSGTLTAGGLYLQGANSATQNRVSQLTIQNGGIANINGNINIFDTAAPAKVIVTAVGTGILNLGGNFLSTTSSLSSTTPYCAAPSITPTTTIKAGIVSFASTAVINFNGTNTLQVLPLTNNTIYGNIYFNNTGNNVATLNGNITTSNVLGDVKIQSGIFTNQGAASSDMLNAASSSFSITGNAVKTLAVDNGATLKVAGTTSFPSGFSTMILQPTSTVDYIGTTQTISPQNFGNLTVSAGELSGRSVTLSSTGTIGVFNTYTPSTTNNIYTLTGSTVSYNGTSAQTIGASFATNFNNLVIANSSTVTLLSNTGISGNLTVSNGTFDLASFTANRASVGGTLTVANNATLKIGGTNTYPINYTTNTLLVASTVEYSGTNQTVSNQLYGNLNLSSSTGAAVKTFPSTALTVGGHLSSTLGNGSSVTFTAASNITVNGNTSIGASTTFNGGSYIYYAGGNWVNNGNFNGNTGTVTFTGAGTAVSGSGSQNFNNLTVAAPLITFSNASISLTGNLATSGSGSFSHTSGGTLLMTGSGKTISGSGISLGNLTVSGSVSTATSFEITGNLSVTGSFAASLNTITMSGSSKNISGTGISFASLFIPGSVTTTADFSISSGMTVNGSFLASAGTVTFTGTSTLSGTANLFNTTINGTSLQLSSNSTLGIANVLTMTTGTLNVASSKPNTVNFNGTGSQNINAITYGHLILSNGNTKTAVGNITTDNLTIETGTTFNPSSYTHSAYGNWINRGTFLPVSSTIEFLGSATAYVRGATTFNILTSNTSTSTTELILESNVSADIVNMINGEIMTGSNTLTITSTRTGNGHIYGNIERTHSFTTGVSYAFEGPFNTINFSAVNAVTSITVSVTKGFVNDFPYGNSIARYYNILVPSGTYTATLRLHYEDGELNGNIESDMGLWNYDETQWIPVGKSTNSSSSNYVEQNELTDITNRWTISINPSVVLWNGSVSSDWNTAANWTVYVGSASTPPSASDVAVMGGIPGGYQPTISTSTVVKNLVFVAPQATTLSIASGGSLTSGDVLGVWSSNVTHTINSADAPITINGNLILSDGVNGNAIDLTIGSGTVTIVGSLLQTGGANINFTSTGTLRLYKNFEFSSGTFTAGSGTMIYDGNGNQHVANLTYNNLTINKVSGIATIDAITNVTGNLLISSGELDNSSSTTIAGNVTIATGATLKNTDMVHVGGNWTNNGTYIGIGAHVKFNGSGTQTISSTTFNNLEFDKPVGSLAVLAGDVTIKGNLVGTSGTLDIGTFFFNRDVQGGSASMADSATLIIGANNAPNKFANYSMASNSTVIFNGTGIQHLMLPGMVYGNVIFRNTGTKILYTPTAVNGDLTIESGATFDGGSNTITLNGNWVDNGTFTPSTSTVICAGTAKTITGNTIFNHLTVSGTYTILSNTTYNGLLNIINTGSLSAGGSITTTLHGDLINKGVLYALGTTNYSGNTVQNLSLIDAVSTVALTVNFNGSVPPVLNSTSAPQFGYLNINNTGGINPSVGWTVLYGLTVSSGASFNGGNSTHNFLGSVTNNGTITSSGTLNFIPATAKTVNIGSDFSSTGTVVFGGAGAISLAGTPVSFHDVVISNTNVAGITPVTNWTITNNLTVSNGAILNGGSHSYLLGGNWTNNGTFNANTSTVGFIGTATQKISGASVTTFNNINVTNTADPGVSVQSNQNLKGILTLGSNVNFDADGSNNTAIFTLLSTADDPVQDAAIAALPAGAQVSGNVTVQRYMAKEGANNNRIYRYISSPLQNATVADIQKELPITGPFTGSSGGSFPSMYLYDETVITDTNKDGVSNLHDGFIGFPKLSNTEILQPARGYAIFVWGDVFNSTLWDVRGTINMANQTPITFPVTFTSSGNEDDDGWNLIGNPFPSVIDWNASSGWTKENMEQSIYVRNNGLDIPNFAVWNGLIGINGGSRYIATAQSFWVKAASTGPPVLQANENIKSSGSTATFFRTKGDEITNLLRIKMVQGTISDELAIHFREGATELFDNNLDARKFPGASFNFSSIMADGTRLSINSLPPLNCMATVKLALDNTAVGTYRLDFSDLSTFYDPVVITLTDNFASKTFDVRSGGSYTFNVTSNAASVGINRFVITFSSPSPKSDFTLDAPTVCEGSTAIVIVGNTQKDASYFGTLNGAIVTSTVTGTGNAINLPVLPGKLQVGQNMLVVRASVSNCSVTVEKTTTINVAKVYPVTEVKGQTHCGAGSVALTAYGAPQNDQYNWYESATAIEPIAGQHTAAFITPVLEHSRTYYVSIVSSSTCESSRVPVTAEIVQSIQAHITETAGTLTSNYENGNQWYFDNAIIPGATSRSIEAHKSGLYRVDVTINTCTGAAEFIFVVNGTEQEVGSMVSVYPNPVVDQINVVIEDTQYILPVQLMNSQGQTVQVATTQVNDGLRSCSFDMQHLPSGFYIVRIKGGVKTIDVKVIKN